MNNAGFVEKRTGAAESRDHVVNARNDPVQGLGRYGAVPRDCVDTSHDRNNLALGNNRVNHNDCRR